MPITREQYRDVGLPILAVLEAIATKGKSPGSTAMAQRQVFDQQDALKLQTEEALRQKAMEDKLMGREDVKFARGEEEYNAKIEAMKRQAGIQQEVESAWATAKTPQEKEAVLELARVKSGEYGKPAFNMEEFIARTTMGEGIKQRFATEAERRKESADDVKRAKIEDEKVNLAAKEKQNIFTKLDDFEKAYDELAGAGLTGPVGGKVGAMETSAYNPLLSSKARQAAINFQTKRKLVGMTITRLFEKGRISDQDRIFYLSVIGNPQADKETFKINMRAIKEGLLQADFETEPQQPTENDPLGTGF